MIESGKTIFVPWDFKGVSEYALDHALFYASATKLSVCLICVVKKESFVKEAKSKLDKIAADVFARKGKHVRTIVEVGSFHSGLKKAADKNQASMIFVGIDGFKGIQKYIGTSILNVISGAVIPSIVVQRPKRSRSTFTILCPIDQNRESKLLLKWLAYFARYITIKVYLVYPEFAEPGMNKKAFRNVAFAKNYLKKERIDFESECFSVYDFNNSIVNFSRKKGVDLIFNLTKRKFGYRSLFTTPKSHYLIANKEKIPVMCITSVWKMWRFLPFK
ncbi:universal stress protein [Ancylomarina sp. 16SWW S1-10-2]|uniref:universal stress protein n=1 Tax=Ancylomarina sp. 16SWW S1-10-2 TaxID=2499681 RepID=UPI0012ADF381|nr:universal stress protein [Ancylomarina sp. 16SWW S1-10-2]MRT92217.1 universal stress protein [Ancylomarina sp. 16SWW S1-10-2]